MSTIPPDSIGGPSGTPEHKGEPSGQMGEFTLGKLNSSQKEQLSEMLGQLRVMGHMKNYNPLVFKNMHAFLTQLENQIPPLKKDMLDHVKAAKSLVQQTLESPTEWKDNALKVEQLLKGFS